MDRPVKWTSWPFSNLVFDHLSGPAHLSGPVGRKIAPKAPKFATSQGFSSIFDDFSVCQKPDRPLKWPKIRDLTSRPLKWTGPLKWAVTVVYRYYQPHHSSWDLAQPCSTSIVRPKKRAIRKLQRLQVHHKQSIVMCRICCHDSHMFSVNP